MSRRTFVQVAAEAVAAERIALVRFAAEHRRQTQLLVGDGRVSADEASLLGDRIDAFVGQVTAGLHVGGDGPETRRAVRAGLAAAGLLPGGRR